MFLTPLMAATFFTVPIASPPHVVLRSIEPAFSGQVRLATTTPDLLQGLASSASGTLPQPIYPAPSPNGGQGKSTPPQSVQPSPSPTPTPQPQEQTKESWTDRIWRRYKGGN
jgi:hypothetical protein